MGRDKALLKLESGQTLLERAVETLRAAGAAEVVVAVGTSKRYGLSGAREIVDRDVDWRPAWRS
jgi:molybdopterin-guanine dinucleotide biosynthesis protein A